MASSSSTVAIQALPADFFHLLAAELSDRLDFPTLFNCAVSSKYLANSGVIAALYRYVSSPPPPQTPSPNRNLTRSSASVINRPSRVVAKACHWPSRS
jgi:hypothetical protein